MVSEVTTAIRSIDDLAIFGAEPKFGEVLHVGRPNIGDRGRLLERINDILDNRWFTNGGPYVQEFERRLAEFVGVKHCIVMCNATVALEIVIRALNLTGEVIVPSFTFVATAHALQWQQITPIFCDINPETHSLDPRRVAEMITPRTTGIIGVHLWGHPCEVEALQQLADKYGLSLLFDAAHALACSYRGRLIGGFGDAEVFSFHATKFFNTLEGGAVATDNDELARKVRLMKNFGFTNYDEVSYIGTNGKMNEFSAAMGLTSLESLDEFVALNRCNYLRYKEELSGVPGITLFKHDEAGRCNYQYIILEVDEEAAGLSRDELVKILWAENVIARRYFYPGCHRMEPYSSLYPAARLSLPQTERVAARVLALPNGQAITPRMIGLICEVIRIAVGNAGDIRRLLASKPLD